VLKTSFEPVRGNGLRLKDSEFEMELFYKATKIDAEE
jgi:hypothetical protein